VKALDVPVTTVLLGGTWLTDPPQAFR
jgi:hypothetical protein